MASNIFIPKKINVGFNKRPDTYTGKLAYIIYYDEKGVLRKEKSWNSWKDDSIPNEEYDNVPTSGFVLNKKAGGYSTGWNARATYVRVFDPRGYEFEISIPNLLYILENTNSIMGKGLDGEFVFGWDGTELVLVPIASPDYQEVAAYTDALFNTIKIGVKDLVVGATYLTKDNKSYVYMGKYEYYTYGYGSRTKIPYEEGKQHFFYDRTDDKFDVLKNLPKGKLIGVVEGTCCADYADIFDKLECNEHYSKYDQSKDEYFEIDVDRLRKELVKYKWPYAYIKEDGKYKAVRVSSLWKDGDYDTEDLALENMDSPYRCIVKNATPEELLAEHKLYYRRRFLENGKMCYEGGSY